MLGELARLAAQRARGASSARALATKYPVVPTAGRGDDAVIEAAVSRGAWVVTADRELRVRLLARGVAVLFPRDRHRLERFDPA